LLRGSKADIFLVAGKSTAVLKCTLLIFNTVLLADIMSHRFVSPDIAKKYDLQIPEYAGIDQVVEIDNNGQKL
jgi:hypothetical protein